MDRVRLLGVLGGKDFPAQQLAPWAQSASVVVAADRGADSLVAAGVRPSILIGDLDSVSEDGRQNAEEVLHLVEQDTTDAEKLLLYRNQHLPRAATVLVGFEGDRLDHLLHAMQLSLIYRALLVGRRQCIVPLQAQDELRLPVPVRTRFSVVPMEPMHISLMNVEWPLHEAEITPTGLKSLSNRTCSDSHIQVHTGSGLLFLDHMESIDLAWQLAAYIAGDRD